MSAPPLLHLLNCNTLGLGLLALEHVDNHCGDLYISKGAIDLQPLLFNFTLDTATALMLGRSAYSLRTEDVNDSGNEDLAENFDIL